MNKQISRKAEREHRRYNIIFDTTIIFAVIGFGWVCAQMMHLIFALLGVA